MTSRCILEVPFDIYGASQGAPVTVLTLPFPVSVNAMYAGGKTRRYKSQKYCDWLQEAGYALNRQSPKPVDGRVRLVYELELKKDGYKRDAFNYEKGVTDLLVAHGVLPADDHTVVAGGSIDWSEEVKGIRVTITSVPHRVSETLETQGA